MEDAKSSANRCLVVVEWIICKAKPRIEVPQGRVVFKDIGHLDKARSFDEIRNGIERMLDGDGIRNKVVPQAKVQGQLRPHSPLVLYITDGVDFAEVAIGIFLSGQGPKKYGRISA